MRYVSFYFSVLFSILLCVFLNAINYNCLYLFTSNIIIHVQCILFTHYLMLVTYMHAIFIDEVSDAMR